MTDFIDIGTRRELFVDDFLIESLRDVRLQLQHPEKQEVAFTCDAPWEDIYAGFYSVFTEGAEVKLYYRASIQDLASEDSTQLTGLAISTDGGRTFTRPELGLVEFKGSAKNNLVYLADLNNTPPAFIDTNPACPPEHQYKATCGKWTELYILSSPDGLHWKKMQPDPVKMAGTFDTINTAFWDKLAGCYRSYTRIFTAVPEELKPKFGLGVRAIQHSTSKDFIHWDEEPETLHYHDAEFYTQLYTNSIQPCPGAEHIYVGFPNRFIEDRKHDPAYPHTGANDNLFMASRDGVNWTRYLEGWVRPGLDPLNWTQRNNYPTWGIVETSPTEWSMYVSEHYWRDEAPGQLRRVAIRPHGFVSLHADYAGGECVMKPFTFAGSELRLNYATSAAGSVQVEVLSEYGMPRSGFTRQDMSPMFGDSLDQPVSWTGGSLASLVGTPVRLRFVLKDADVFAMRTT